MSILSDAELREAMATGEIAISPTPQKIEPASVDLTLGGEAFLASADEVLRLEKGKLLILPPGELALLITREELRLSASIAGHFGLRSFFTRKGLVLLAGPQIDPGFEGTLHTAICNLSPTEISLAYGEPFCTVEFHRLLSPAEATYKGDYQKQKGITPEEIRDIRERRGYALSEVIKNSQTMARDISALTKDISALRETITTLMNRVNTYMAIFMAAMAIFAAAIVALVVGILAKL